MQTFSAKPLIIVCLQAFLFWLFCVFFVTVYSVMARYCHDNYINDLSCIASESMIIVQFIIAVLLHSKKYPGQRDSEKGSIGAKLHSGSAMTWKSLNLTRKMTQSWVNLTPLFVKSAESWPNSGSLLTQNGVWPRWILFRVTLTRVFYRVY